MEYKTTFKNIDYTCPISGNIMKFVIHKNKKYLVYKHNSRVEPLEIGDLITTAIPYYVRHSIIDISIPTNAITEGESILLTFHENE